ncbi:MAG TPA: tetratricopeptide repeat protein [Spirochaetia bacterium]|jgi:Ca-activated chloride channel family protein|nr:tetratricopeptide repeat protein [Spirochaetia bacterium]
MEKYLLILFSLFVLLGFCSCGDISSYRRVIAGNYHYAFGNYEDANMAYLQVAGQKEYEDVLQYNLGNVYHAVGEAAAARSAYESALTTENPELRYKVLYNYGILRYEMGDYSGAYSLFRQALELEPASMDAKVNLESTFLKMNPEQPARGASTPKAEGQRKRDETDAARILDYIQRKEEMRWLSTEKITPDEEVENW